MCGTLELWMAMTHRRNRQVSLSETRRRTTVGWQTTRIGDEIDRWLLAFEREHYAHSLTIVQEKLGKEQLDKAQHKGRVMTLEQAAAYALGEKQ